MTLPKQTHLQNHKGTYYFRRRIPLELLPFYSPKLEIRYSLKTKDYEIAKTRARKESANVDKDFESFRSNLINTKPQDCISDDDIQRLADSWIAHVLEEDEEFRTEGLSERDYIKIDESLGILEYSEKRNLAKGDISLMEFEMNDFCESHGFYIAKGTAAYQRLSYSFLKASVETHNLVSLRQQGEIVKTPEDPMQSLKMNAKIDGMDSLEALRDYWLSQSKKSRSAIAEASTMIKKFRAMVGDLKPSEITRQHIVILKDKMLEAKSAPATINKGRGILGAIFSTAEENFKIDHNPFKGIKSLPIPQRTTEKDYTIEELKIIFNSPIYTQGFRPKRFQGESAYWVPLLALYTGARLNELGQIFAEDVGMVDGVNFFMIKPDT